MAHLKSLRCVLTALALTGVPALAQDPQGPPPPPKPEEPAPQAPAGDQPIDETNTAAEALRRLIRGETKPLEEPPTDRPIPQGPPLPEQTQQDPEKPPPLPPPVDPTDEAARILQGRAPGAQPREQLPEGADPTRPGTIPPEQQGVDETRTAGEMLAGPPLVGRPVPEEGVPFDGWLFFEWRHRHAESGDHDSDLLGLLAFDIGDPARHDVTAHFLGRSMLDLDGEETINVFNGIEETYDSSLTGFLYEAWVDLHSVPYLELARVGRQTLWETPEVLFLDGVYAETEEFGEFDLQAGGYFGLPTRVYDSVDSDSRLGGAMLSARPWRGGRLRFDWTHAEDDRDGVELENDLIGLAGWQSVADIATLHARFNWLDDDPRDLFLSADTFVPEADLQARVSYRELLTTQRRQTVEFDPYWTSAFDWFPFRQLSLLLSKGLGERWVATGGLDVRRLDDTSDEGQFNRDFERYYLTGAYTIDEPTDLTASVTVDWWDSGGEDILALGADVTARPFEMFETSVGTYYSRYKYDEFSREEHTNVRTIYARFDYELAEDLRWKVDYRFEDDDFDRYHVLETGFTWYF